MTAAKIFQPGTEIKDAVSIIMEDCEDLVRGCIVGVFSALEMLPTTGINLSTVIGVNVTGTGVGLDGVYDGYMISITPTEEQANKPYDEVCKTAIFQRFIGVDETGRAKLFTPVGVSAGKQSQYLQ